MPGKIIYDGTRFIVRIRKRACTPILLGIKTLNEGVEIPWLVRVSAYALNGRHDNEGGGRWLIFNRGLFLRLKGL